MGKKLCCMKSTGNIFCLMQQICTLCLCWPESVHTHVSQIILFLVRYRLRLRCKSSCSSCIIMSETLRHWQRNSGFARRTWRDWSVEELLHIITHIQCFNMYLCIPLSCFTGLKVTYGAFHISFYGLFANPENLHV